MKLKGCYRSVLLSSVLALLWLSVAPSASGQDIPDVPSQDLRADEKMEFTTEEFVASVINEVEEKHKIDPKRTFTLSWSSGGPPAYAISLTNEAISGSFVAMSGFYPSELPTLEKARGNAYYLYHSPTDCVTEYRMAEQAAKALIGHGAKVKLATYQGGHGWKGPVHKDIRAGITWLEKNSATPAKRDTQ